MSLSVVESYRLTDEHTYISAAVTALIFLSVLLGLVVLYNKLAPKSAMSNTTKPEATNHSNELEESKVSTAINMDLGEGPYVLIVTSVVTLVCIARDIDS